MSEERARFFERLRTFLSKNNIKASDTVPSNGVVVVTLAANYDLERDRRIWKIEANRSEPRDVNCAGCDQQVVMSNGLYAKLKAGEFRRDQVRCSGCLFKKILC